MTRFGIIMDEDYNATHKRKRFTVWSGPFASNLEGEGLSLPKGDGYMITTYYGGKVRVTCPVERTGATYEEQDKAINDAMNAYYAETDKAAGVSDALDAKPFVPNGKRILNRR